MREGVGVPKGVTFRMAGVPDIDLRVIQPTSLN